jgi:recombinational DNA repair protein RecR
MAGYCDPPLDKQKRFSKDYQPPNESKRKPKKKTIIKRLVEEHLEEMIMAAIEQGKKGNVLALEKLLDRAYGKVTQNTVNKNVNMNIEKLDDGNLDESIDKLLELRTHDETTED